MVQFRRVRGDAVPAARDRRRPFYRAALAAPPRPGGHHRHSRLAAGCATAAIVDSKTPKCARARSATLFDLHRRVRPRRNRSPRREARHDALDTRRAFAGAIPRDRSAKQRALRGHGPDHHVGWIRSRTRYDAAPCSDRKSTRLNSSHVKISYAVFCLKKKKKKKEKNNKKKKKQKRNKKQTK